MYQCINMVIIYEHERERGGSGSTPACHQSQYSVLLVTTKAAVRCLWIHMNPSTAKCLIAWTNAAVIWCMHAVFFLVCVCNFACLKLRSDTHTLATVCQLWCIHWLVLCLHLIVLRFHYQCFQCKVQILIINQFTPSSISDVRHFTGDDIVIMIQKPWPNNAN
jgi:hypothetical protein